MGGDAQAKICLNCAENPIIKGKSWIWHCKSKHSII